MARPVAKANENRGSTPLDIPAPNSNPADGGVGQSVPSVSASSHPRETALSKPKTAFEDVDKWALAATLEDEKSLDALGAYLAKGCHTEKEKARAVYRWITDRISYDVDWLRDSARNPLTQNPDAILLKRKTDCVGYANLFVALASRMKVNAVRIDGYFKLPDHKPGQKVTRTHTWNGVQIGGQWFLLDATAGAGGTDGEKAVKNFSGYFFLIDPEQWIFSYFPREERWQLLGKPVTLPEFEGWPYVSADLCRFGASVDAMRKAMRDNAEMVRVFSLSGYSIRLVDVPLGRSLESGREYRFSIRASEMEQVGIWASDSEPRGLEKDGDLFSGMVIAAKGFLQVWGKPHGAKGGSVFLEYVVK